MANRLVAACCHVTTALYLHWAGDALWPTAFPRIEALLAQPAAERATAPPGLPASAMAPPTAAAASDLALAALTAPTADPPPPTGAAPPAPSLATQNIAVAAAMAQLGRTPASAAPRAAPAPRTAASKRALFHARAEAACADSCKPLRRWARSDLLRGVCFPLVAALVPDPPQIDRVQELLGGLPPRVAGHIATACRRVAVRLRPYYGPYALWETAFPRVLILLGRLVHPEGTAVPKPRAPAPAGRAASAASAAAEVVEHPQFADTMEIPLSSLKGSTSQGGTKAPAPQSSSTLPQHNLGSNPDSAHGNECGNKINIPPGFIDPAAHVGENVDFWEDYSSDDNSDNCVPPPPPPDSPPPPSPPGSPPDSCKLVYRAETPWPTSRPDLSPAALHL